MLDIFNAADSLRMPYLSLCSKQFSIPALLRTLYATGMRVGEAIDIDLEKSVILIKKTKNQRQRIVPINVSLKEVLAQYVSYRNKMPLVNIENRDVTFFIAPNGSALSNTAIGAWFGKILKKCGIPFIGGNHGPRIHDIRHTCAVHSLMAQVRSGADIYCVLPILSTFLGHKTLIGTERYIRLTQEMYPDCLANSAAKVREVAWSKGKFVLKTAHTAKILHIGIFYPSFGQGLIAKIFKVL